MWKVIKFGYRVLRKLRLFYRTTLFRLKYFPFVKLEKGAFVEKDVRLTAFWINNKPLKLHLAERAHLFQNVLLQGSGQIFIGKNSYISSNSTIGCNESIFIGENVMIAQNVSIRDTDHNFFNLNKPMIYQGVSTEPIVIEDNVWIGSGVTILKGVRIGGGAIVAAGAVVTRNIPQNTIVAGIPAKILRIRNKGSM